MTTLDFVFIGLLSFLLTIAIILALVWMIVDKTKRKLIDRIFTSDCFLFIGSLGVWVITFGVRLVFFK